MDDPALQVIGVAAAGPMVAAGMGANEEGGV